MGVKEGRSLGGVLEYSELAQQPAALKMNLMHFICCNYLSGERKTHCSADNYSDTNEPIYLPIQVVTA